MNDAWIEVDQGRRQLDWAACFGDLNEAGYLTTAGREAGSRAVNDLEAFFGADWLHWATNLDPPIRPNLPPFWPSLMKAPAFVAAIGLWARLQMLVVDRVKGIGKLRKNLRANPVRDEFRHDIAQARLSVQAMLAGARVVIEPTKPDGGPGDVLAIHARHRGIHRVPRPQPQRRVNLLRCACLRRIHVPAAVGNAAHRLLVGRPAGRPDRGMAQACRERRSLHGGTPSAGGGDH